MTASEIKKNIDDYMEDLKDLIDVYEPLDPEAESLIYGNLGALQQAIHDMAHHVDE